MGRGRLEEGVVRRERVQEGLKAVDEEECEGEQENAARQQHD